MKIKYEDLKCEFCDGCGEFSHDNSDGVAVEGECHYCNGTGIDQHQLGKMSRNNIIDYIQTNLMQNWYKKSASEIYDSLELLKQQSNG